MARVPIANLKGPKGDTGATGAPGEDATISGENDDDVRFAVVFEDDYSTTFLRGNSKGEPDAVGADLIAKGAGARIGQEIGVETANLDPGMAAVLRYADDSILGYWLPDGTYVPGGMGPTQAGLWPAAVFGDSTSYGTDLADPTTSRWTTLLAARVGRSINNFGQSSARAEEIAARYGGVVPRATVTGGQIPASGTVTLTGFDANPLRGSNITSYIVDLRADDGTLVRGSLSKTTSTTSTFTRQTPGSAVTSAKVDVVSVSGPENWSRLTFVGIGINNWPELEAGRQSLDQVKAWYRSMTALAKDVVVWGVLDRGYAERPGTQRGDWIAELERWLAQEYGSKFCAVRQHMASPRALEDLLLYEPGFTPTAQDLADQAAGTVPVSLRSDPASVHLNERGHWLQARWFDFHLRQRGLV